MSGRKGARRALSVNPHVAKFRMRFFLHQVMTDLIDQFEVGAKDFAKGFGHCSKIIRRLRIA